MESESRYALVGGITLAILAAAAMFTIWLGQVSFDQEYLEYDVVFSGPVRGLSKAGEVRFNGIKVGEVENLGLDKTDPNNIVIARIKIFAETPVKEDSYAQLEPQGITGLSYIQIYGGSANSPPLRRSVMGVLPKIPSQQAQLDGLFAGGEDLILTANNALVRVNTLLSTKNLTEIAGILEDVHAITAGFAAEETLFADLGQALRAARAAADALAKTAPAITQMAKSGDKILSEDAVIMLASFTEAATQIQEVSAKTDKLIADLSGPLTAFSEEGLSELTLMLFEMRALTQAIERVVEEVDRNPVEFITGEPVKEVEVPR